MSAEAVATIGVGVALLAVLVPLILTLHGRVVAELGELRRDLHALAERVARVDGALTGPWISTNGSPAAAPKGSTRREVEGPEYGTAVRWAINQRTRSRLPSSLQPAAPPGGRNGRRLPWRDRDENSMAVIPW